MFCHICERDKTLTWPAHSLTVVSLCVWRCRWLCNISGFLCVFYSGNLWAVLNTSQSSSITKSLPLKSQVNKWKVFVSRPASPASWGRVLDLETMCCGLLFCSLPLGSPSLCSLCCFTRGDFTSLLCRIVFLRSLVTFTVQVLDWSLSSKTVPSNPWLITGILLKPFNYQGPVNSDSCTSLQINMHTSRRKKLDISVARCIVCVWLRMLWFC